MTVSQCLCAQCRCVCCVCMQKAHLDETTHGGVRTSTRLREGKGKNETDSARSRWEEERRGRRSNDWREQERKEENKYGDAGGRENLHEKRR